MAASGARSIEVTCANDTEDNLTVVGPALGGGSSWIAGEQPGEDDTLEQSNSATWGVFAAGQDPVSAQVQLVGQGDYPVVLTFQNLGPDQSSCQVTGNDRVAFMVKQIETGDDDHSLFEVQLFPASGGGAVLA